MFMYDMEDCQNTTSVFPVSSHEQAEVTPRLRTRGTSFHLLVLHVFDATYNLLYGILGLNRFPVPDLMFSQPAASCSYILAICRQYPSGTSTERYRKTKSPLGPTFAPCRYSVDRVPRICVSPFTVRGRGFRCYLGDRSNHLVGPAMWTAIPLENASDLHQALGEQVLILSFGFLSDRVGLYSDAKLLASGCASEEGLLLILVGRRIVL
jgi:hypothetical protein